MSIALNIDTLLNSQTVESNRIEYKKGWNPEEIIRTMCAFANDINEVSGGYIFIGIEEDEGLPVLPPHGLPPDSIDGIQKKIIELCNYLYPSYFPRVEPAQYQGKLILVLYCFQGEERPYNCPSTLGKKPQRRIYVRQASLTIPANAVLEKRLRDLSINVKFENKVNARSTIDDIDVEVISEYLIQTRSILVNELKSIKKDDLCKRLLLLERKGEFDIPLNYSLLLFSKDPSIFFLGCYTNVVVLEGDDGSKSINREFKGAVHVQIQNILNYFNDEVVIMKTIKSSSGEVNTIYNYPPLAIKEIIVNMIYHRSYENDNPNEIRLYIKCNNPRIEFISYPGALPPINEQDLLDQKPITARTYRNPKLGSALKDLGLSQKVASGIPTIISELKKNGSPPHSILMDEDRTFFSVSIGIQDDFYFNYENASGTEDISLTGIELEICELLNTQPLTENELIQYDYSLLSGLEKKELVSKKSLTSGFWIFKTTKQLYFLTERGFKIVQSSF